MTIDEILDNWKEDSKVNLDYLAESVASVSKLHSKYVEILMTEKARLYKLRDKHNKLKKIRWEYWNGKLDISELKEYGWDPQPLTILKADLPMYLEADELLSTSNAQIFIQEEKVYLVESILKNIAGRGFNIKAAIDWNRFTAGG